MPRKHNPGIYTITHIDSKKKYVGSSVLPKERLAVHRRELRKGLHSNAHLQNAWNLYGEDFFIFNVIEEGLTIEQLESKENEYIIKFGIADEKTGKFFENNGYNMCWAGREGFKDPARQKKGKEHHLHGKENWRKGKTFEELFGEKVAGTLRSNIAQIQTGRPSPKKYKHKHSWGEMSYNRQYKLWKNNDPMVPTNWVPRRKGAIVCR